MVLWMVGFPDRGRDRAKQAMALAEDLEHPSSVAYVYFHAGLIHLWRREPQQAEARTLTVLDIADEYDFQIWRAVGSCLRGAALAEMGSEEEGLALIEVAMSTYQRLQSPPVFWPLLLHIQAGVCGAAGRPADGLVLQDEAIEIATQGEGEMLGVEVLPPEGGPAPRGRARRPGGGRGLVPASARCGHGRAGADVPAALRACAWPGCGAAKARTRPHIGSSARCTTRSTKASTPPTSSTPRP